MEKNSWRFPKSTLPSTTRDSSFEAYWKRGLLVARRVWRSYLPSGTRFSVPIARSVISSRGSNTKSYRDSKAASATLNSSRSRLVPKQKSLPSPSESRTFLRNGSNAIRLLAGRRECQTLTCSVIGNSHGSRTELERGLEIRERI